jgi:1-deoxy-D-xylulose-5-phosphate reductoisomerase
MAKKLAILGSTGSIGTQTLEIVASQPNRFEVVALTAGKNVTLLAQQIRQFKPLLVVVGDEAARTELCRLLGSDTLPIEVGLPGLQAVAQWPGLELIIVAIFGTTAILPTYTAICRGVDIGLACKEVLVSAGPFITAAAKTHGARLLPVDSEHAALQQCLGDQPIDTVDTVILTASGGPFWDTPTDQFAGLTVEAALRHPNWTMGSKITIDSATLMNKGLEVIEAHYLFGLPFERIQVVIHPQSMVHAAVEFIDGNMIAHLGRPDMRFPIQYALTYPEKVRAPWPRARLQDMKTLTFFEPDTGKFPLLNLAYRTGAQGGAAPVAMNAANEVAVQRFLNREIGFMDIPRLVTAAVDRFGQNSVPTVETVIALDEEVKTAVRHAP